MSGAKRVVWLLFCFGLVFAAGELIVRLVRPAALSARGLLNFESLGFVCLIAALLLHSERRDAGSSKSAVSVDWIDAALIAAITAFVYARTISNPLLADDFGHLAIASQESWSQMLRRALIDHPRGGDYFFRPLGYLSYWIDFHWAGTTPALWHAWNVAAHIANSVLLYVLCRQLRWPRRIALFCGGLFAIQGSHAEVVAWAASRFDLLACFFTLLSLVSICRFAEVKNARWMWCAGAAGFFAVCSKEAAFCLPLLAICLIPLKPGFAKAIGRCAAILALTCALVFAYRTWMLGGIGGYRSSSGSPTVLDFHPGRVLNGLFYRQWGVLFFPINWSTEPGPWLRLAAILLLISAAILMLRSQSRCATLLGCLGFTIAAALPAQHLLLIGTDLWGSRVLYLSSVGFALLWGPALQGSRQRTTFAMVAGSVLLFQWGALEHNLQIWCTIAHRARANCLAMANELAHDPRPIAVYTEGPDALPVAWDGVPFLADGFVQCVAIQSGKPDDGRIHVNPTAGAVSALAMRRFQWSPEAAELRELPPESPQ